MDLYRFFLISAKNVEKIANTDKGPREWNCPHLEPTSALVAAARYCELTGDGREHALNLVTQCNQDGDGDHGNEGENQGVLHKSLTLLALHPAQRAFGAKNYFVDHILFTTPLIKNY